MTTNKTIAEVAAGSLAAVRTLEGYGLDYCCGGKTRFDEECRAKRLNPELILGEIERAQGAGKSDRDWQAASLGDLVRHIVATHHEYLKLELPALSNRLKKVCAVHGARDPETLTRLAEVFDALRGEMEMHMHKEETALFPCIEEYGRAEMRGEPMPPVRFGSIAGPIGMMECEHEDANLLLAEIRTLTHDYQLPQYACTTVRTLYEGLQAIETDLHVHVHLENNILFPRAMALETR